MDRGLTPPPPPAPGSVSWWYADALARLEPLPPLAGEHAVDVAIVGGGFSGLWTAIALRERDPGRSVMVLEAHRCGSAASGKERSAPASNSSFWMCRSTVRTSSGRSGWVTTIPRIELASSTAP